MVIRKIIKRDGSDVDFDPERIVEAINKASAHVGGDSKLGQKLLPTILTQLEESYKDKPTVEQIQDVVEDAMLNSDNKNVAKAFILYRHRRKEVRDTTKVMLGKIDSSGLNPDALTIAKTRYLEQKADGTFETPTEMFKRVAKTIAKQERDSREGEKHWEEQFFNVIKNLEFLPGGRILAGAGIPRSQLSNCFVIPMEDHLESILRSIHDAVIIQKYGGGTGFSLSKIRSKGTIATLSGSTAIGPVNFLKFINQASGLISKTGGRKASNMGSLSIHHPNIIEFITAKDKEKTLQNFNISVEMSDEFMEAISTRKNINLVDPTTQKTIQSISARKLFSLLSLLAWKTGDPGVLFIDEINRKSSLQKLGTIETTDPCGEQPMLAYENTPLGALNLTKFVENKRITWKRLEEVIATSIRFLDDCIDASYYPIPKTKEMAQKTRRVGLGLMGFADLLYMLEIPYNSEEALAIADKLMSFIKNTARNTSSKLGEEKGNFLEWEQSTYAKTNTPMRNCGRTCISPTGTSSIIAGVSSSIEPNWAISYKRIALNNQQFNYVHDIVVEKLKEEGLFDENLLKKIIDSGNLSTIEEIPTKLKKLFVTTHDVSPKWHVRMQSAFQKHVDGAISKTVNLPYYASEKDVEEVFLLAWKLKCKGITVYRDGCKDDQVLDLI